MTIRPLHLSHSVHHADGGIAFAVSDLVAAQHQLGLYSRWLSADRFPLLQRDKYFVKAAINSGANLLHCHGLWRTQTRVGKQYVKGKLPIIISPHGMLDDWAMAHSFWKKEIVWHLWESEVLDSSACLHALCDAEARAIQKRVPDVPIAVIPNGVNLPSPTVQSRDLLPWNDEIPEHEKVLLFLGRFHQKKGLEPLMTAWQSVIDEANRAGWWLVFVGFGDQGKFQSQLDVFPVDRCRAYGAVFGEQKISSFQHASAFILPSYSEGLPMAALEAMSHGLPCLLSSACNLPEAFKSKAALHAEPETSKLISSLKTLFAMSPDERYLMGRNGQFLISDYFHWERVAKMMAEVYAWTLGDGPKPASIYIPST